MTDRIALQRSHIEDRTPDIAAYTALFKQYYAECNEPDELKRKAGFLTVVAERIPIVLTPGEWFCGSLRSWQSRRESNVTTGCGHIAVDYRTLLREGICGVRRLAALRGTADSAAFVTALDAFSRYMERCALAEEAAETAGDPSAGETAAVLRHLLTRPPETFRQALQLVWSVHVFLHLESMAAAESFGRMDMYLFPFFERDLRIGRLTEEGAQELLASFFLKTCEGDESQNLTIGGPGENALTLLILKTALVMRTKQPSLSMRVWDGMSRDVWQASADLVRTGIGMPSFVNDGVIIRGLEGVGVAPRDAENYAIVGCYEANSEGNTFGLTASLGNIRLIDPLLLFLDTAKDNAYPDFAAFLSAFRDFFREYYNGPVLEVLRKAWERVHTTKACPFESACIGACLDSGLAAEHGGCQYTMAGINILGIGTLTDSLYAIRRLVFEERRISLSVLVRQVQRNFPDKAIAKMCRDLPGKYGTDSSETNTLAAELADMLADLVSAGKIADGVVPYAGLFVFLQDVHSSGYPATPDGRFNGERVSYGVGPSELCLGQTPTSVLNSAASLPNDRFPDGNPLLVSLDAAVLQGDRGTAMLRSLIRTFFENGGFQLHVNTADAALLHEAREKPEEHRDLLVRISGYSEYYTRLDGEVQDFLIRRAECAE